MDGRFNPVIDTIEHEELLQIRNAG
jgi:hypothetical protein